MSNHGIRRLLPAVDGREAYASCCCRSELWEPAVRAICRRHGLATTDLAACPVGTHIVFRVGSTATVKLFAPFWEGDVRAERAALSLVRDALDVPVPQLVAEGEFEGWPYLVLTWLEGRRLDEAWPELTETERLGVAEELGLLLARLHAVPAAGADDLVVDWPSFLSRQRAGCAAHHRAPGYEAWVASMDDFLERAPDPLLGVRRPVLLHADVTREHLLLSKRNGRWTISGLFDFGDAMVGPREYEFVAACVDVVGGWPEANRLMLTSYGWTDAEVDGSLGRTMGAYLLLHRYARIGDAVERVRERRSVATLDELVAAVWG